MTPEGPSTERDIVAEATNSTNSSAATKEKENKGLEIVVFLVAFTVFQVVMALTCCKRRSCYSLDGIWCFIEIVLIGIGGVIVSALLACNGNEYGCMACLYCLFCSALPFLLPSLS